MTYIAPVLGLLAGVAGIADTIPYVRDTVHGSTRPHRGTWLICPRYVGRVCPARGVPDGIGPAQ